MKFSQLMAGLEVVSSFGEPSLFQVEITGIEYDSRRVTSGNLFVAMRGESTDGNRFIDAAIAGGAVVVVSDSATQPAKPGIPWLQVRHGRRALAALSANFFGHPALKLKITGITGTNGKTTTAFLLSQILKVAGRGEPVLIGTIEYQFAGKIVPAPHTT